MQAKKCRANLKQSACNVEEKRVIGMETGKGLGMKMHGEVNIINSWCILYVLNTKLLKMIIQNGILHALLHAMSVIFSELMPHSVRP